jgi:hypothetical protein
MPSATVRGIGPHPIPEKCEFESFRATGTDIIPGVPMVSERSPHGTREINVSGKVKPDERFGSWQAKI